MIDIWWPNKGTNMTYFRVQGIEYKIGFILCWFAIFCFETQNPTKIGHEKSDVLALAIVWTKWKQCKEINSKNNIKLSCLQWYEFMQICAREKGADT